MSATLLMLLGGISIALLLGGVTLYFQRAYAEKRRIEKEALQTRIGENAAKLADLRERLAKATTVAAATVVEQDKLKAQDSKPVGPESVVTGRLTAAGNHKNLMLLSRLENISRMASPHVIYRMELPALHGGNLKLRPAYKHMIINPDSEIEHQYVDMAIIPEETYWHTSAKTLTGTAKSSLRGSRKKNESSVPKRKFGE